MTSYSCSKTAPRETNNTRPLRNAISWSLVSTEVFEPSSNGIAAASQHSPSLGDSLSASKRCAAGPRWKLRLGEHARGWPRTLWSTEGGQPSAEPHANSLAWKPREMETKGKSCSLEPVWIVLDDHFEGRPHSTRLGSDCRSRRSSAGKARMQRRGARGQSSGEVQNGRGRRTE